MENVQCLFLDDCVDFFSVLALKLGREFVFTQGDLQSLTGSDTAANGVLQNVDVIIFGLSHPGQPDYSDRFSQLQEIVANAAGLPVVVFLPAPDHSLSRDVVAAGAYDCFAKTSALSELAIILHRAKQFSLLRRQLVERKKNGSPEGFDAITTADPDMEAVIRLAAKVAGTDANVLITGETGTGKEVLAQAIHRASPRAASPFVAVACASLPESLIEAELFGHEKGAFTGAVAARRGRFEAAEQGTILLDEVGELTPALQVKLLRVLQERKFERLGSNVARPMQARVICATHRDLHLMMSSGAFRADLYYRFNTVQIEIPPLRGRPEDVPLLANLLLRRHAQRHNRPARQISMAAMFALRRYAWPGNIRELEHAMEHAAVLCDGRDVLPEHLPAALTRPQSGPSEPDTGSFETRVRDFKRQLIGKTLELCNNNKVQTARLLNLSRSSLHRLIDELGIEARGNHAQLRKGADGGAA